MNQKKVELKTEELKSRNWNRIKFALILLLGITLVGCTNVELYKKAKDVRAKELNAGPCYSLTRKVKKKKKYPTGLESITDNFRILSTADTIDAKKGAHFGIEFIVFAEHKTLVPITVIWNFPNEIENDKGKKFASVKYKQSQFTHTRTWAAFELGADFLVIKGEWKLEIFHKKKKILEKVFYLV